MVFQLLLAVGVTPVNINRMLCVGSNRLLCMCACVFGVNEGTCHQIEQCD